MPSTEESTVLAVMAIASSVSLSGSEKEDEKIGDGVAGVCAVFIDGVQIGVSTSNRCIVDGGGQADGLRFCVRRRR